MSQVFVGTKFDSNRDVAEIAKLFRADVKAALKTGALPAGLKVSVKIDRYSMGCSIDVTVAALPEGICCPFSQEYLRYVKEEEYGGFHGSRYVPSCKAMLDTLNEMLQAYNRNASDPQSDYYNVKFSGSVGLGTQGRIAQYFKFIEG